MGYAPDLKKAVNEHGSKGNGSGGAAGLAGSVRVEKMTFRTADFSASKSSPTWAAKLVVSCYKLAGLALLVFILLGLGSYLGLVLFYAFNTTWITPQIISPTDEYVLRLKGELSQAAWLREKLWTDRLELLVRLRDAVRQSTGAKQFQREFRRSVAQSQYDNRKKLEAMNSVAASYGTAAPLILRSQEDYLSASAAEAERLYKAHMIDEAEYLSWKHQLSAARLSGLSLQKDGVDTEQASKTLDREVQSFDKLLKASNGVPEAALSYEVLRAKREYDSAMQEQARAMDLEGAIREEIGVLDREIARQNELMEAIRSSPYLLAAKDNLTLAHLPYGNGGEVRAGTPVFGCRLGIVMCRRVGQVTEALPGEVVGKHPFYNRDVRGVLVQIQLEDPQSGRKQVLFLNQAPLFF